MATARGSSIRTKFQLTVVLLALAAIGTFGAIASLGASDALRQATYDRLTAIRETRRHALERYFEDLGRHVTALSTSETTTQALLELREAWPTIGALDAGAPSELLRSFYRTLAATAVLRPGSTEEFLSVWFPQDPRVRMLQHEAIAANPHPVGVKDLLLEVGGGARLWGDVHARHHPTFHRYQSAFGFYDIFLISAPEGRVLYTVMKETDLGVDLTAPPYRDTGLGRVYARVIAADWPYAQDGIVIEDFSPYVASSFAPAAFIASRVRVAGATVGVLAMQISIREVDRVMTQGRNWREGGFGDTGQAYVVGADHTLRSDLRGLAEDPAAFYASLGRAGVDPVIVQRVRTAGTTVLNLPLDLRADGRVGTAGNDTELGVNLEGEPVLRSQAALDIPGLRWNLVAEITRDEALAPVRRLQSRIWTAGVGLAAVFFLVAGWLGASVTQPILELARTVTNLGAGERGATVPVRSSDEVGTLATAFNRMSEALERTTVSKGELEALARRLITAQEDERRRVGRELHDDLVQRIAAMAIEVGRLAHQAASAEEFRRGLDRLKQTLAALSEDVHGLSRRIHPAKLDDLGLVAAIEAECRAFMERGGPPVDLRVSGDVEGLSKDVTLATYRMVQETLRNIQQHADANEVTLTLACDDAHVRLGIADDGRGFDQSRQGWRAGLGLASMEERARLLGGELSIESRPGEGTRIDVTMPRGATDAETQSPAG